MENREHIVECRPMDIREHIILLDELEPAQSEEKERDLDEWQADQPVQMALSDEWQAEPARMGRMALSDEWQAEPACMDRIALSDEWQAARHVSIGLKEKTALHIYECIPLYKAAISDDWEAAQRFFEEKQIDLDVPISLTQETALHIAVGNSSNGFVEKLIDRITTQSGNRQMLRARNRHGETPLQHAGFVGNTLAAKLLINQDSEMSQLRDSVGNTALKWAAKAGRKKTLCYLLEVTKDVVDAEDGTSPYRGVHGAELLIYAIAADFYDVALYLVNKYPDLAAMGTGKDAETGLGELAKKPNAFQSGSRLGFWQRIIYQWIPVNREEALQSDRIPNQNLTKASSYGSNISFWSTMLQYLAPQIKKLHDSKVKHIQAEELVKQICSIVMNKARRDDVASDILGAAILPAVKHGIHELMEQCLHHFPALAGYRVEGGNFVLAAIRERQENIYNLVYQMSGFKAYVSQFMREKENALHVAGKLAPPHRLNIVTGAALQMQRELQWFKEIENFVHPRFKESFNRAGKTPRMVFTFEHKELLKDAKEWMKDTSSSATVVAALIVTMAFAAMFTVPGGNNDNGKPLFLNDGVFILFATSDAVALFSSATSVLMFLSILSSRFAEEDFLYSLPKRLMFGLISLFISLAATMVAFSVTLSLVLRDKIQWIAAPVILLASVPVTLFMLLQYPLLVELVRSTYGKGIFYKQNDLLLH